MPPAQAGAKVGSGHLSGATIVDDDAGYTRAPTLSITSDAKPAADVQQCRTNSPTNSSTFSPETTHSISRRSP
jgi:hypothetical protein